MEEDNLKIVTMQIFQRTSSATLCGMSEVIELLQEATGYYREKVWVNKFSDLKIEHLNDGDTVAQMEPVLHIIGPYAYFAHLESIYLGVLARRTSVATKVRHALVSADSKPVLFFADRFDSFVNQEGDGYAAHVGGVESVATPAQAFLWNGKIVGTIPHALIAVNEGDTLAAVKQFAQTFPDIPVVALVDFENDCVATSLQVARTIGEKLWGVRLDTSEKLIDLSLQGLKQSPDIHGVNPQLVQLVRDSLDKEGFSKVKIIVSGGFTSDKIAFFEKNNAPVDIYGVGSWFVQGTIPFTADIVTVDGKEIAKVGRKYTRNERMHVFSTST